MSDSRVDHLSSGIKVLDFNVSEDLLVLCGLPADVLEQVAGMSPETRESAGSTLDIAAESIAAAYLSRRVNYWDANAVVNALMATVNWRGPMKFWQVFLAFEDSETLSEPDVQTIHRLTVALAGDSS